MRALDNVIDLNFYALPYAKLTNRRYRSIGLASAAITICWPSVRFPGKVNSTCPL